ncbi:MAG TPA: hypothetical protein PKU78_04240 [Candidatus Dojkabacteria bacterium]|nr:hypothetical protein [Candidatus Dojkabacteria bacterium]HRO65403.1 hypothetical protein [Candidatus Dojkabacteria bacterium]
MNTSPKKQKSISQKKSLSSKVINRDFGTNVDRDLGKYLQRRGLPALAEILKIDK